MKNNVSTCQKSCRAKPIKSEYLKIIHYNLEGSHSETHGNKLKNDDCIAALQGYDLIALTETHASKDTLLELPGYIIKTVVRPKSKRAKKYSGGIALAIKDSIINSVKVIEKSNQKGLFGR